MAEVLLPFPPSRGWAAAGGCGRAGAARSGAGAGLFRGNGAEMGCILIKQKKFAPLPRVSSPPSSEVAGNGDPAPAPPSPEHRDFRRALKIGGCKSGSAA